MNAIQRLQQEMKTVKMQKWKKEKGRISLN